MAFDIRSYQPSPGVTQVETNAPGMNVNMATPGGMPNYGDFFQKMLQAKLDFERWKVAQQMKMQQNAQRAAQVQEQRAAMQGPGYQFEKPVYNPGTATYATYENPLTPFTGLQINAWQPGMRLPTGSAPVATGFVRGPSVPVSNPGSDWLKYFAAQKLSPGSGPAPDEPDTRAGYFGSTFGKTGGQ